MASKGIVRKTPDRKERRGRPQPDPGTSASSIARDLHARRKPVQPRGERTFNRILDATAELLDQSGFDSLSTNLIAERAGINVAAVYKYFPNKYAILTTLATRLNDLQTAIVLDHLGAAPPGTPWQDVLAGIIDAMVKGTRNQPGFIALQRAMLASPGLQEVYRRSNALVADHLLRVLERSGVSLPPERRELIGLCIGEVVVALMDLSVADGRRFDTRVIEELKRMQIGYIASYVLSISSDDPQSAIPQRRRASSGNFRARTNRS